MAPPNLRVLPCPAGPAGLDVLVPPLTAALDGAGPPLALFPEDAAGADRQVRPDEPLEADGVAALVTTSGSTGEPKSVLLPAAALRASAVATLDRIGGPGQWLLALPPHYVAGLQVVVRSVVAGTTPVALEPGPFTAEAFAQATARLDPAARRYAALVPTQLARALADPAGREALAAYDTVLLGGAAAPARLLDQARRAGVTVLTTYGMSETCGGCVYDGRPLDGVTADIRPDGRIRLAGPVLAAGYRLRPDLSAAAFTVDAGRRWHVTPDLGRFADDGTLEVLGRADDVAVSGGVNVPLAAVERALAAHPGVTGVACLAAPDPEWGERVVAFVTVAGSAPTLDELRDHVAAGRPRAWAPRELVVLDELPLLASGKPDRRRLRARLAG
ncbi:MAG TPA: o-succinylbenzoate--CoA ligase [Streptosporangiales bacterium]